MSDECTGPFSDAMDCPIHDPRRRPQAVSGPHFDDWASELTEEMETKSRSQIEWEIVEALQKAYRLGSSSQAEVIQQLRYEKDELLEDMRELAQRWREEADVDHSRDHVLRECADRLAALPASPAPRPQEEQ